MSAAEPGPRPLTGGAAWSGISQVTTAAGLALTGIAVARLLGPDGTGSYALAATLFAMLLILSTLGLEQGISYYVAGKHWGPRAAWGRSQLVALGAGLVGAGLGVLARVIVPSAFEGLSVELVAITAAALPFALSWFYAAYVALATDRYERYAVPQASQALLALAAVTGLAAAYGLEGAIVGLAASQVVVAIATGVATRRALPRARAPEEPGILRKALSFGFRGYLANALQFFNYRLDLFVLAAVASQAQVGYYSIAVSITSGMWLLPGALSSVVLPRIAALGAADEEDYRDIVQEKSMRHVALIVAVMTVFLALALIGLVSLIYGADFQPAVDLGLILLPGVALLGIASVLSATIVGRGFPNLSLRIALISTPITIALYAILVPWLKADGAALASSISYSLNFVLALRYYRRVTGLWPLPLLVPTRSELEDYGVLLRSVRARLASRGR